MSLFVSTGLALLSAPFPAGLSEETPEDADAEEDGAELPVDAELEAELDAEAEGAAAVALGSSMRRQRPSM